MTEAAVPAAPESSSPLATVRDALEIQIARGEEEVNLLDRLYRQLSARIAEAREKQEQVQSIRTLVLRNVTKYKPEELAEAFDQYSNALADLSVAEQHYEAVA